MIEPEHFCAYVIRPVLARLECGGAAAERLLLGTALAESGLKYLAQLGGGPARGLYQIEPATHDDVWHNFLAYRPELSTRVAGLMSRGLDRDEHDQLLGNLDYATAIARMVYLRRPEPLPAAHDPAALAAYWKAHYNTRAGAGDAQLAQPCFARAVAAAGTA